MKNPYKYINSIEKLHPEIILSLEWDKITESGSLDLYRKTKLQNHKKFEIMYDDKRKNFLIFDFFSGKKLNLKDEIREILNV